MDEFLRSASHSIVTSVLLVIWSGLLLGTGWKAITFLWNAVQRLLPRRLPNQVKTIRPAQRRLSVTQFPALVANSPFGLLADVPTTLLLPPHNEMTDEVQYFIPLDIEI